VVDFLDILKAQQGPSKNPTPLRISIFSLQINIFSPSKQLEIRISVTSLSTRFQIQLPTKKSGDSLCSAMFCLFFAGKALLLHHRPNGSWKNRDLAFPGDVADRHWGGLSMGKSESESHHG
jgi:hypothetical protein